MKNNLVLFSFLLLAVLLQVESYAQDALNDFKKSQTVYSDLENYHGKMVSTTFGASQEKVLDVSVVEVKKKGGLFRYRQGEIETIINPNYMVMRNEKENILTCSRVYVPNGLQQNSIADLEKMLESYQTVEYKGLLSGSKCYVLKDEAAFFDVVEIYFDATNFLIQKVVYHYGENTGLKATKVEMICHHLNLNPRFSDSVFSEKEFVRINGNLVTAQSSFAGYTLILGDGLEYAQD